MSTPIALKTRTAVVKQPVKPADPLAELRATMDAETKKREIIQEFINAQLKEGVDYGSISINGRTSKPTLFKPGMEKIFSLFSIVSQLEKDEETLSMISTKDVIAYKCKLFRNGQFLGEGRGAVTIAEKGRVNDAIKIAEKRARMDACLNLGFSEYFTQDLDDWKNDKPVGENAQHAATPTSPKEQSKRFDRTSTPFESLEFTVDEKNELQSQTGNPYARLKTDKGTVISFKNTMDRFEEGGTYLVSGLWEEKNGSKAFVITCPANEVRDVSNKQSESSAQPAQEKARVTLF